MRIADRPELLDQLAASYALGSLRGGARRRFEALARESATVRTAALLWRERFASMTELQAAEVPSPNVWKRIELALAAEAQAKAARPTGVSPDLHTARAAIGRAVRWWRGATGVAALAAVAAVAVGVQLNQQVGVQQGALAQAEAAAARMAAAVAAAPRVQYVSVLHDDKAVPTMLVTMDRDHNTVTLKRVDGYQEPADRSLELWALPAGGRPRSLGVLGNDRVIRLVGAAVPAADAPAMAVTLEPKGGAPGPDPTGPILFKGVVLQTVL